MQSSSAYRLLVREKRMRESSSLDMRNLRHRPKRTPRSPVPPNRRWLRGIRFIRILPGGRFRFLPDYLLDGEVDIGLAEVLTRDGTRAGGRRQIHRFVAGGRRGRATRRGRSTRRTVYEAAQHTPEPRGRDRRRCAIRASGAARRRLLLRLGRRTHRGSRYGGAAGELLEERRVARVLRGRHRPART